MTDEDMHPFRLIIWDDRTGQSMEYESEAPELRNGQTVTVEWTEGGIVSIAVGEGDQGDRRE